jgi:hypothetical protein
MVCVVQVHETMPLQNYYVGVVKSEFRRHANETNTKEIDFQYGKGQRFLRNELGGLL